MLAPSKPGVYLLMIDGNKHLYLGSTHNLKVRISTHVAALARGTHYNQHLQRAYNQNPVVLAMPLPTECATGALKGEQELLNEFYDTGLLFNMARDAVAPMRGRTRTPETNEKMRQAMLGRKHSHETIELLKVRAKERGVPQSTIDASAAARKGKPLSPEHIEKVRASSIERMKDPAARENLSKKNLGIKHTAESIALMKEKCKGRVISPQAREAQKVAMQKIFIQRREAKLVNACHR